jgi:glutathione S-transferase
VNPIEPDTAGAAASEAAITLYHAPGTRAARVAFLLEELGVPYRRQHVDLARGEHKQPHHLRLHPHGLVPVLRDGESVVFETAAICLYLADRFADRGLAPRPESPLRAAYYQWVVYAAATLDPVLAEVWTQQQAAARHDEAALRAAQQRFASSAAVLTRALAGPYLLGTCFSTADILIGCALHWAQTMGLLSGHGRLADYVQRVVSRPAFDRA